MSNPVTDAEVEDVLSSIRRLVSSDIRPVGPESDVAVQPSDEAEDTGVNRLVLSPALRVTAVRDGTAAEVDNSADRAQGDTEIERQAGLVDNEPAARDKIEPETSDSEDQVADMAVEDDDTEPEPDALSSKIDPEELRFLFRARKRPTPVTVPDEDEMAATEASETDVAQAPEIIATDEVEKRPPLLLTNPQPGAAEYDDGTGVGELEQLAASDEPVALHASNKNVDVVPPEELTAKIATLESVVAQKSDQCEPDDEGADEYAGTSVESLEWEDHYDHDASGEAQDPDQAGQAAAATADPIELEAEFVEPVEESLEDLTSLDLDADGASDVDSDVAGDDAALDDLAEAALEAALEGEFVEPEETAEKELTPVDLDAEEVDSAEVVDVEADEVAIVEPVEASAVFEVEAVEPPEATDDEIATVGAIDDVTVDPQSDLDDADLDASDDEEEALLDEEALRELVSEIVRQELNGKLGERITHNVRKLVRRELQRALASQDLE